MLFLVQSLRFPKQKKRRAGREEGRSIEEEKKRKGRLDKVTKV